MHRCGWIHDDAPEWAHAVYHQLYELRQEMGTMTTNQEHLQAGVDAENASLDLIEAEIAKLKAQPGAEQLDFSSFDALTSRLKGDEPVADAGDGSDAGTGDATGGDVLNQTPTV